MAKQKEKLGEQIPPSENSPEPPPVQVSEPVPPAPQDTPPVPPVAEEGQPAPKMSLADLAAHAEGKAPDPNEEAIRRKIEKEKATGRGQNQEGKKRGPYKKDGAAKPTKNVPPEDVKKADELYKQRWNSGIEVCEMIVGTCEKTISPEWGWRPPQVVKLPSGESFKISEQERGHYAFGRCFAESGWDGPTRGWGLVIWVGTYAMSRLNQPQTKEKVTGLWSKFQLWRKKRELEKKTGVPIEIPPTKE